MADERGGSSRRVFVNDEQAVRTAQVVYQTVLHVEGHQGLYVDDFGFYALGRQKLRRFQTDAYTSTVSNDGQVRTLPQTFRYAEGDHKLGQVRWHCFVQAVPVEHLDHDGRVVSPQ